MPAPPSRGGRGGSAFRGGHSSTEAALDAIVSGGSRPSLQNQTARGAGKGRGRGRGNATSSTSTTSGVGALQALRNGTFQRDAAVKTSSRGAANSFSTAGRGQTRPTLFRSNSPTSLQAQSLSKPNAATPNQFRPKSQSPPVDGAGRRGRSISPASITGQTRGKSHLSQTFDTRKQSSSTPVSRTSTPNPQSQDFMSQVRARYELLKQAREKERAKAIRDGMLADPEKKRTLDQAITPVGTCTEKCPEFERLERIVQNMVDKSEKVDMLDGSMLPSEVQMVKRFRRSAAGYDEQLPSDIRTPATLKETLDYLIDQVVDGPERLAVVHKFVWDRTRAIRNDFSIQQLTKEEDVQIAVECYERIARFHIYSLHHFSNPENLNEGEDFNAFQEREQLQKTLLSLLYYYNDNAGAMRFPNEAEFRAYCIIRELQTLTPDIEDQLQTLPTIILQDQRVQTALALYNAAGNTLQDQGPLQPFIPFALAQNQFGSFWGFLNGPTVSYTMACVAETYFPPVRFAALDALWRSVKKAPVGQQARTKDWTLDAVSFFLGFDGHEQTIEFCSAFGLAFAEDEQGNQYLDFTARDESYLDKSQVPAAQIFSQHFVEEKRCFRNLASIINGVSAAEAIRSHSVQDADSDGGYGSLHPEQVNNEPALDSTENESPLFFPDSSKTAFGEASMTQQGFGFKLNPTATPFTFTGLNGQDAPLATSNNTSPFQAQPLKSPAFGEGKFSSSDSTQSPFGRGIFAANNDDSKVPTFGAKSISEQQKTSSDRDYTFGNWQKQRAEISNTQPTTASASASPLQPPPVTTEGEHKLTTPFKFGSDAPINSEPEQKPFPSFNFAKAPSTAASNSPSPLSRPGSVSDTPASKIPVSTPFTFPSVIPPASIAPSSSLSIPQQPLPPTSKSSTISFNFGQVQPQMRDISAHDELFPTTQAPISIPPAEYSNPKTQTPLFNFTAPTPVANQSPNVLPSPTPQPTVLPAASSTTERNTQPVRSTTPPVQPPSPIQPKFDKAEIIKNAARLAITEQSQGLMQQFLEFKLQSLLKEVFHRHVKESHDKTILRLKNNFLMRKYFPLWRHIAWRKYLNRKAKTRRHAFAESLRVEVERKKRKQEELDEILRATEESKRMQEAIKKSEEATSRTKVKENNQADVRSHQQQLAGTKRKSFRGHHTPDATEAGSSKSSIHHKRSRTIGSSMPPPPRPQANSPPATNPLRRSIFNSSTSTNGLNRSKSVREMRASQLQLRPKIDETKTDFFRLLAHGMDPNTPLVPMTASQIREKAQLEKEEKKAALDHAYNRRRVGPSKTPSTPGSTSPTIERRRVTPSPSPAASVASSLTPEQEDLIRELQEARNAMADDTQWFKEQTAAFEKELEQGQSLKTGTNHRQSYRAHGGTSMTEISDYQPAMQRPGSAISRTEQLIRARGPRTITYKPLGGEESQYTPVAMSKRSAMRYGQTRDSLEDDEKNAPNRKRSRRSDIDRSYRPLEDAQEEDEDNEMRPVPAKRSKGARHLQPSPAAKVSLQPVSFSNPYGHLRQALDEEEDLLEDENGDDDDDQEQSPEEYYRNGVEADAGEDEEDEIYNEAEDGDEETEEESDEDDLGEETYHHKYLRPQSQPYDDAPTPATQKSAASSGPGATEDDAIELSD